MTRQSCRFILSLTAVCVFIACGSTPLPQQYNDIELPAYTNSEDIVRHIGYTASYNHTTLIPDWVAWELTATEVNGQCNGQYSFSRDPDVAFPKASREDYAGSGWDKGHMAPRADMKWSEKALEESYYLTNICPQDHEMNSGAWRKIEELTRRAARRHGNVYIVCGPVPDSDSSNSIGPAKVSVPGLFFKALAINNDGCWHTVGFIVQNTPQTKSPHSYAVNVDSVETLIGRDLFPALPEESESIVNWHLW